MTSTDLASPLDVTALRPDLTSADVHRAATSAIHGGARAFVAAPAWTSRLATMLQGSGVRLVSAVGFPFGGSKSTVKAIEATSTIKDGADEIEVVVHLPYLMGFDLDGARAELMEIVRAARATRRDVVIRAAVELAAFMRMPTDARPRAFEFACRAARESGCDGIVTGTGFYAPAMIGPADLVAVLKPYAEALSIKATIVDHPETARAALEAGADRVGTSDLGKLTQAAPRVAPMEAT